MRIENILHIAINDFQLCDIIHGRRQCILVKLNSKNAPSLIYYDANGLPIFKNTLVLPIPYSKICFYSTHITLTGESCVVHIKGIRPLYNKNPNITDASPLNGHILCYDLGIIEQATTNADYSIE